MESAFLGGAEVHLKMSKKIAQLTKVIFHLNTRNEDFQMEFRHLKQLHQREMDQLSQSANTKLQRLQETLVGQHQSAIHQLQRDFGQEKAQLMSEFSKWQQQTLATSRQNEQLFQQKMDGYRQQLTQLQREFADSLVQLRQLALDTSNKHKSSSAKELQQLQQVHQQEVADLVTTSNLKYNQMLADQLKLQDELKSTLAASQRQLEAVQLQASKQLADTKSQLQSQLQSSLGHQSQEFDKEKQTLLGKMENLLKDLDTLRTNETQLRQHKSELQTELQTQRKVQKQLELDVHKATQQLESLRKDADANAHQLTQTLSASSHKVEELAAQIESLQRTLAFRQQEHDASLRKVQQLELELVNQNVASSEASSALNCQLKQQEMELVKWKDQVHQLQQQLRSLESESQKHTAAAQSQLDAKHKALEDLKSQLAAQKEAAAKELSGLQALSEKSISQQLKDQHAKLSEGHRKELEELSQRFKARQDALANQLELDKKQLKDQMSQLSHDSLAKLQAQADQQLQQQQELQELQHRIQSLTQQLEASQQSATDQEKQAHSQIAELTGKLQTLWEAKTELDKLIHQHQETVATQKREIADLTKRFETKLTELTTQNRQAQQAAHKTFEQQLQQQKQTLESRFQEQMNALQTQHQEDLANQLAAQTREMELALKSQSDRFEEELHRSKAQLAQLVANEVDDKQRLERLHQEQVGQLAVSHTTQLQQLIQRHAEELEQLRDRAADELQQSQSEFVRQQREKELVHQGEVDRLVGHYNQQKSELLQQEQTRLEKTVAQLTQEHQQATQQLLHKCAVENETALSQQAITHNQQQLAAQVEATSRLNDLRHKLTSEMEELKHTSEMQLCLTQKQWAVCESALKQKTLEAQDLARQVEDLQSTLAQTKTELTEKLLQLERSSREQIENLKRASKQDMDRLLEENLAETKLLSDQFEDTKRMMLDKVHLLKQTVAEWELKYNKRESRSEDLELIRQLELRVDEKDALVRQTIDEMAYLKRELLNREETYNKTFARAPNVGVMQVLKPSVLAMATPAQQAAFQPFPFAHTPATQLPSATTARNLRKTKPLVNITGTTGNTSLQMSDEGGSRRNVLPAASTGSSNATKSLPPLGNQLQQ